MLIRFGLCRVGCDGLMCTLFVLLGIAGEDGGGVQQGDGKAYAAHLYALVVDVVGHMRAKPRRRLYATVPDTGA